MSTLGSDAEDGEYDDAILLSGRLLVASTTIGTCLSSICDVKVKPCEGHSLISRPASIDALFDQIICISDKAAIEMSQCKDESHLFEEASHQVGVLESLANKLMRNNNYVGATSVICKQIRVASCNIEMHDTIIALLSVSYTHLTLPTIYSV